MSRQLGNQRISLGEEGSPRIDPTRDDHISLPLEMNEFDSSFYPCLLFIGSALRTSKES